MEPLTVGSLFSGIGGLDLGFERAGFKVAWQVENDAYCTKVLAKHWPDVARYGDVRHVGKHNLEPVDCVVGGFPCQDISVAGKQDGIDGERSGLWKEFYRIICEMQPRWVVVENVKNLLSGGEWVEHKSERCVCGWDHRWGGMHNDLHTQEPERACLCGSSGCRDECESDGHPAIPGSKLWWPFEEEQRENGQVGRSLYVDDMRESHHSVFSEDTTLPYPQSRASTDRIESPKHDNERSGVILQMDARDEGESAHHARTNARTQSQGTKRTTETGMVCPSCGGNLGDSTGGYVYRSWMGVVLEDLAKARYDAEWRVLSAAQFGAPHLRERVIVVAHASNIMVRTRPNIPGSMGETPTGTDRKGTGTICGPVACSSSPLAYSSKQGLPIRGCTGYPTNGAQGCAGMESELERYGEMAYASSQRREEWDASAWIRDQGQHTRCVSTHRVSGTTQPGMGGTTSRVPAWLDGYQWPAGPGQEQYEWEAPRVVAEKVANRTMRLKGLGNTVVVALAESVARDIMAAEVAGKECVA